MKKKFKILGSAKVSTRYQLVIPKDIRERIDLDKRGTVIFLEDEKGNIIINKSPLNVVIEKED
ncbi:MAG: AbrB/MazE/SpoVT family DNA-binding domain-containing protein [Methanocellales archaeon]|nr:AbrB/MazE/SpoVT family DNA-binding domain-containing protein [Methanocellales archaeon]MDI6902204.1 AbrB/MazE/SpoVT family DNA-binding domain-containing protein [Methanocellales archaeon]